MKRRVSVPASDYDWRGPRCACGNVRVRGASTCTACAHAASIEAIYATVAARQVGLRERIKARWPSYDAVGQEDGEAQGDGDMGGRG